MVQGSSLLSQSRSLLPTIGLLLAAIISGVAWLPLRAIERNGIAGLWVALSVIAVACIPVVPVLARLRGLRRRDLLDLFWIAALIGVGFSFYVASLTATEVARAILLFYVAPVWTTGLEVFVLRRPLTLRRVAALGLGAAGLIAILGVGIDLRFTANFGDVLALLSGVSWSVGLLFVFRRSGPGLVAQSAAVAVGALIGAAVMVLVLERAPMPDMAALTAAAPWLLLTAAGFVLPLWMLSMWAARNLPPARATLIFMAEVCIGVGSAALWADQPFGVRETIGTILVLSAGAVEFAGAEDAAALPQGTPPA